MKIRLSESKFRNILTEMVKEVLLSEGKMSLDDVYNKYYSDIDKNIFLAAVKSDPTSKRTDDGNIIGIGKYVKWILKLVKQGKWKPGDSVETIDFLGLFDKRKNQLPQEYRDINRYKSVPELGNIVSGHTVKNRNEVKQDAEKVYEDDKWLIVIPHTKEAACYYGANTEWCTAATESDNMFDFYNNKGLLYINIDKVNNCKYQFHFESNQFMDENDKSIDPAYIGLSEGAINYYKSIGKGQYFFTFEEIQRHVQQGDYSIFNMVREQKGGVKICWLKDREYFINPNGEIIDNERTCFKDIESYGDGFMVYDENDDKSLILPVGKNYELIKDKEGRELWSYDIFEKDNCFRLQPLGYNVFIQLFDNCYKILKDKNGNELFDYIGFLSYDDNVYEVTNYGVTTLLIKDEYGVYKFLTNEQGEELWFDEIRKQNNVFWVRKNGKYNYLVPDGNSRYKLITPEEYNQYLTQQGQNQQLAEMINRLVRNYKK